MTKNITRWVIALLVATIPFLMAFTPGEWSKVFEQDGVVVYSTTTVFTDYSGVRQEVVLLRMENTNEFPVSVTFYLEAWYGDFCRSCGIQRPNDYNKKISLNAGQVMTGSVSGDDATLRIHSGYPDKPGHSRLTKFNLADFKVVW